MTAIGYEQWYAQSDGKNWISAVFLGRWNGPLWKLVLSLQLPYNILLVVDLNLPSTDFEGQSRRG